MCDCNSDALNHTVKPGETQQHSAPYDVMTGAERRFTSLRSLALPA